MDNITDDGAARNDTDVAIAANAANNISELVIPLFVLIFILAVVGNSLVLATLTRHRRLRTVTNVYLLNLAVADILLGVFCMPFTLIGQILRSFVFGSFMCKIIPFFQAVSVSVAVWTLVAISLERYFAICRPLKSRRWQTQFHASKMIAIVWCASIVWNIPILFVSKLKTMRIKEKRKCREEWPNPTSERIYNLFLDGILLLVPLVIMSVAYSLISYKLWRGLQRELKHSTTCNDVLDRSGRGPQLMESVVSNGHRSPTTRITIEPATTTQAQDEIGERVQQTTTTTIGGTSPKPNRSWLFRVRNRGDDRSSTLNDAHLEDGRPIIALSRQAIRSNYMDKSIEAKKKVIRMLFVVVTEFFVCWAPLHILNTWYLFSPETVYKYVGSNGISLVQLLAYASSCSNPITYCFMNFKFRQAFLSVFKNPRICCCSSCCDTCRDSDEDERIPETPAGPSRDLSGESTFYAGRHSRTEMVTLGREERV